MQSLQSLDTGLFQFINGRLANPVFDQVMPFLSGNSTAFALLWPAIVLAALWLVWKTGLRGLLCLLVIGLAVGVADGVICKPLKHVLERERPFLVLPDVRCLVGKSGSGSMPSSHAANWFSAAMVLFLYFRRSVWFMLPAASLVAFSRVYNGVHYPSDIAAGALLGAGSATAVVWLLDSVWGWTGRKWFPLWWQAWPSLLHCRPKTADEQESEAYADMDKMPAIKGRAPDGFKAPHANIDAQWLRLGYIVILVLLAVRWAYIAGPTIQLVEDEAYQWLWSKHLALSYFSKPPLIAYTQFLGTSLWGDNAFGVRFFSPLITAVMSFVVLRFFAREVNARAGFMLVLIVTTTPLLALGSVLMTVDPLSVMFWTLAMLSGWRAVQDNSTTRDWFWVGLWMGLGFLSKATGLAQLLCWLVFFVLWPPARKQLRRPGPYVALLVNLLCAVPVLVWNYQHDAIMLRHIRDDAGVRNAWRPTLKFLGDFLGMELGLMNPVFFIGAAWACVVFFRKGRHNPKLAYFFSMGAPLFLVYLLYSLRSRILPNWIAPAVVPLFCLMVIYWDTRARLGTAWVGKWLTAGLGLGAVIVVIAHNTDIVGKAIGKPLPVKYDPLHRVREWDTTALTVGQVRDELLKENKPVFIITDHYGMAGQISFYLPEARAQVRNTPLVYYRTSPFPMNQFYYWPGYTNRKGDNAIFVVELSRKDPKPIAPPPQLLQEFESVTDMGVRNVMYHDQYLLRPLQFFACRGLR